MLNDSMFKYQWTNGTKPERSIRKREKNISLQDKKSNNECQIQHQIECKESQSSIYSIHAPQLTPMYQSYIPTTHFMNTEDDIKQREDTCIKMGEREMMSQIGQNPFFSGNLNYADQLAIQDKYLKPVSSVETNKGKLSLT
tara:strand:- start:191 stop:613 length:423 start_codon:yes stop_codon:yes gene_type:complete